MLIHRKIVWHFNLLSVDDICTCHGPWWGWPEFKIAPIHAMSVEVVVYCLLYRHGALWLQWQKFLSYNQKYKILMFFIKKNNASTLLLSWVEDFDFHLMTHASAFRLFPGSTGVKFFCLLLIYKHHYDPWKYFIHIWFFLLKNFCSVNI